MSRYRTARKCSQKTSYPGVRNFHQFSRNSFFNKNIRYLVRNLITNYKYCLGLKVEATACRACAYSEISMFSTFKFWHTKSTLIFKILDARQSEIHIQFTPNTSFTLCPGSAVAATSSPKQYLKELRFERPKIRASLVWASHIQRGRHCFPLVSRRNLRTVFSLV